MLCIQLVTSITQQEDVRDELTGVRLGDEEENKTLLRSEGGDVDVFIFLVFQSIAGKRVPDVNGREVDAGGPLRGLGELGLNDCAEHSRPRNNKGKIFRPFSRCLPGRFRPVCQLHRHFAFCGVLLAFWLVSLAPQPVLAGRKFW